MMSSSRGADVGIVAWGDSLTAGRHSGIGNSYPEQLGRLFDPPKRILNRGAGQMTADGICERMISEQDLLGGIVLIWAGTADLVTNPKAVEPAIERMVTALGHKRRFLVFSVMNTDRRRQWRGGVVHQILCGLNGALSYRYGHHFLDVRSLLLAGYDSDNARDCLDYERDVPPTSLRVDKGHLNEAGNSLVAKAVYDRIVELWP